MITTIVFDIGGVFFHQPDDTTQDFRSLLGLVDQALVDHTMFKSDIWNQYKRGGMSEEAYWTLLLEQLTVDTSHSWETLCQLFDTSVKLDMELVALAKELKKTYNVHALSNAGVELERRLDHFELTPLFGEVINSHYVKMAKPDVEIYTYTSELIEAKPEQILFVDDKPRNTVIADDLGWNTHIYTNAQNFYTYLIEEQLLSDQLLPGGRKFI